MGRVYLSIFVMWRFWVRYMGTGGSGTGNSERLCKEGFPFAVAAILFVCIRTYEGMRCSLFADQLNLLWVRHGRTMQVTGQTVSMWLLDMVDVMLVHLWKA